MASSSPASTLLFERLSALGLDPGLLLPRYEAFYELLMAANQRMNLTRITDWDDFCRKHVLDSLSLLPELQAGAVTLLDLGSGGGIPGIPLWLARPQLQVTLLDSVGKKLKAAAGIGQALSEQFGIGQPPATLHMRAEDAGQNPAHRGQYDVVVARAVATLPVLVELCLPLVRRTGRFIAMKGPNYDTEMVGLNQICGLLGGRLDHVTQLEIGGEQRTLLVFEKRSHTPKTLPRPAGQPKKKPLTEFLTDE